MSALPPEAYVAALAGFDRMSLHRLAALAIDHPRERVLPGMRVHAQLDQLMDLLPGRSRDLLPSTLGGLAASLG